MTLLKKRQEKTQFLLLIAIFIIDLVLVTSLQCKGEDNKDVDWYVLYKLPKIVDSNDYLVRAGLAYLYMDSKSYTNGWTLSKNNISSNNSIPAYTLAPFYDDKNSQNLLWFLYNDQAPNVPVKFDNGHAKGVVIANENNGFWLIHSVPHFPPEPNNGEKIRRSRRNVSEEIEDINSKSLPVGGYAYPATGKINGQSFLCISTNQENFNAIGKQLMYNQVNVYRKNLPHDLSNKFSVLANAANQIRIRKAPFNNKVNLYSSSGMEFISFAKSSKWLKDLYDDFVAPQLETDLYAETWLNGPGKLPSECSTSRVMNVKSISISKVHVHFKSSRDHSKWAVSIDDKKKVFWICIGDINRASSQFKRGGGTVCLNLPEVWKNYKNSVDDFEPCPKPKSKGFLEKIKSWFG